MENEAVVDPNVSLEVVCVETLRTLVCQVQHAYMYGKCFGIRFGLDFHSVYRQFDEIVNKLQQGPGMLPSSCCVSFMP